MKNRIFTLSLILIFTPGFLPTTHAETKLDSSHNNVTFNKKGLRTGNESRAAISNAGGTIRVGANSSVGIRSAENNTLDLEKGVMMVSTAKKGLGRQSLTVETEQIKATTNAKMLISYQPRRYIKIACIEGRVTVSLKGLTKNSVTIRKGQMLIINCLENLLPAAVSVDMNQLMQTSPLLGPRLRGGPAGTASLQGGGPPPNQRPPAQGPPQEQQANQSGPPPGQSSPDQLQQAPTAPEERRGLRLPNNAGRPRPNNRPGRRMPPPLPPPPPH